VDNSLSYPSFGRGLSDIPKDMETFMLNKRMAGIEQQRSGNAQSPKTNLSA